MAKDFVEVESIDEAIEIFHGNISPIAAQLYVRVAELPGGGRWSLSGTLRGPKCQFADTLPVNAPLLDLGDGDSLLGAVRLSDPCFWSTDLPALYDLQVCLHRDGEPQSSTSREVGFRCLGADGNNLRFGRRRWVLRGVAGAVASLQEYRESSAVLVITDPDLETCHLASRMGVLVVARLTGGDIIARVRQLAHCPAVAVVIPVEQPVSGDAIHMAARNVLVGQHFTSSATIVPADWADLVFCEEGNSEQRLAAATRLRCPAVLVRQVSRELSLAAARRACDTLQSDYAQQGDFAGYVVALSSLANTI